MQARLYLMRRQLWVVTMQAQVAHVKAKRLAALAVKATTLANRLKTEDAKQAARRARLAVREHTDYTEKTELEKARLAAAVDELMGPKILEKRLREVRELGVLLPFTVQMQWGSPVGLLPKNASKRNVTVQVGALSRVRLGQTPGSSSVFYGNQITTVDLPPAAGSPYSPLAVPDSRPALIFNRQWVQEGIVEMPVYRVPQLPLPTEISLRIKTLSRSISSYQTALKVGLVVMEMVRQQLLRNQSKYDDDSAGHARLGELAAKCQRVEESLMARRDKVFDRKVGFGITGNVSRAFLRLHTALTSQQTAIQEKKVAVAKKLAEAKVKSGKKRSHTGGEAMKKAEQVALKQKEDLLYAKLVEFCNSTRKEEMAVLWRGATRTIRDDHESLHKVGLIHIDPDTPLPVAKEMVRRYCGAWLNENAPNGGERFLLVSLDGQAIDDKNRQTVVSKKTQSQSVRQEELQASWNGPPLQTICQDKLDKATKVMETAFVIKDAGAPPLTRPGGDVNSAVVVPQHNIDDYLNDDASADLMSTISDSKEPVIDPKDMIPVGVCLAEGQIPPPLASIRLASMITQNNPTSVSVDRNTNESSVSSVPVFEISAHAETLESYAEQKGEEGGDEGGAEAKKKADKKAKKRALASKVKAFDEYESEDSFNDL